MSRWIIDEGTERLPIPGDEGEWVEIKSKLTVGDQDTLKEKLVDITPIEGLNREQRRSLQREGKSNELVKARYRMSTAALLTVAIVDWSLTSGTGEKIPVTPENIARMDPYLANWLEDEVEARNPLAPVTTSPLNTEMLLKNDQ